MAGTETRKVNLLDSLLDAIVRLEGDALVMHVGEKPYVVTTSAPLDAERGQLAWGQVELSSRVLTTDAVLGMLVQIIPLDQRQALEDMGAIAHEIPAREGTTERFTVIAARGGDDVWLEVRRRPEEEPQVEAAPAPPMEAPPWATEMQAATAVSATPAATEAASVPATEVVAVAAMEAAVSQEQTQPVPEAQRTDAGLEITEEEPEVVEEEEDEGEVFEISLDSLAAGAEQAQPPAIQLVSDISQSAPTDEDVDALVAGITPGAEEQSPPESYRGKIPLSAAPTPEEAPTPVEIAEVADEPQIVVEVPAAAAEERTEDARPAEPAGGAPPAAPTPVTTAEEIPVAAPENIEAPVRVAPFAAAVPAEAAPAVAEAAAALEAFADAAAHVSVAPEAAPSVADEAREAVPLASERAAEPSQPAETIPEIAPVTAERKPFDSPFGLAQGRPETVMAPIPVAQAMPEIVEARTPEVAPVASSQREEARPDLAETVPAAATPRPAPAEESRPALVVPISRSPVRPEPPAQAPPAALAPVEHMLRVAAARGASTVYIVAHSKPMIRVDGEISALESEPTFSTADVERLVMDLAPVRGRDVHGGPGEWMTDVPEVGRVRCVTFREHRGPGVIFRMIPPRAISADQLGLPAEVQALCGQPDGLVLVTGARASGKSTLLSAFVDLINRTRSDHVITVESQINFVHESRKSFVSQREVRGDAEAAAAAVRSAFREDPDVLVIEDLRTAEIVSVAIEAAESGRLVLGSLSAPNTIAAIERLVELFSPERRVQVQTAMAGALRGVVAQVLLRKMKGGRIAAREVLLNTPAVASLILEGRTFQLPVALDAGRRHGMVPLTDSLAALVRDGAVHVAEAYRKALDREALLAVLKREGIDTSFAERLA